MAKITRSLDDIEKLVKKAHQTPKEQLKEVQEQLKDYDIKTTLKDLKYYKNVNGVLIEKNVNDEDLRKYHILKEAEKILLEQIESEEEKQELNKIKLDEKIEKNLKKEIKEALYDTINDEFTGYSQEKHALIYDLLHRSDIIDDKIKEITDVYGLEFKSYALGIYIKTLDEVYKLYKYNVKKQEKQQKEAAKRINQRLKRSIAHDVAIIGLLKLANKKKNYRR